MENLTQKTVVENRPEFVDARTATRLFGVSRSFLYQLIASGEIKSVSLRRPGNIRGRRLFVADSIREFITNYRA